MTLGDRIERRFRRGVEIPVERRRIGADGEGAQHLARIVPPRSGQLAEHHVAFLHLARRGELRRHADVRLRHRGDADVVDQRRAAVPDVGALDESRQLALGHPGSVPFSKDAKPCVAERGADAQPVDLLLRLDRAAAGRTPRRAATTWKVLFELAVPCDATSGPMSPTRFAPRRFSSSMVFCSPRCSPQCTSVSTAMRFASGKWLNHSTGIVMRSPGLNTT